MQNPTEWDQVADCLKDFYGNAWTSSFKMGENWKLKIWMCDNYIHNYLVIVKSLQEFFTKSFAFLI